MRTDQYIGLNERGKHLVKYLEARQYATFDGAFYNTFPLHAFYEKEGWLKEPVYVEFIQEVPWSSGPMYFLALMTIYGEKIEASLWTEAEIEEII